jgi:hypothetical protein
VKIDLYCTNAKWLLSVRREIRKACGAGQELTVYVIDGGSAPKHKGTRGHHETRGGSWIVHPSAYSRTGWSNMRYVCSTRRVEVGQEWVIQKFPEIVPRMVAINL